MASHAIFQYNVLAIDDIHNTWTNMIIKMIILRLLGSSDDKEKIGVARAEGPPHKVMVANFQFKHHVAPLLLLGCLLVLHLLVLYGGLLVP